MSDIVIITSQVFLTTTSRFQGMARRRAKEPTLLLKGTRTAMSFVAEARRLAISDPYPEDGQAGYSVMADVLARAVLFANWEVVGAAALIRAGDTVRVAEAGLIGAFRTDEYMRRLTWRMLADAAHELADTVEIQDAWRESLDIAPFINRRRVNRAEDKAARPMPIGRLTIPMDAAMAARLAESERQGRGRGIPRAPRGMSL
jgi:hypothetical protein